MLLLSALLLHSAVGLHVCSRSVPLLRTGVPPQMTFGGEFMRRMSQMTDGRVAEVSTIVVKFDTKMTLEEAYASFEEWKTEIGDDPAKFAEVAKRVSEDPASGPNGGNLGFVTRARQLPPQLDEVVFAAQKPGEEKPGVYGPIGTTNGLELIYLHYCGEPEGEMTLPWNKKK